MQNVPLFPLLHSNVLFPNHFWFVPMFPYTTLKKVCPLLYNISHSSLLIRTELTSQYTMDVLNTGLVEYDVILSFSSVSFFMKIGGIGFRGIPLFVT